MTRAVKCNAWGAADAGGCGEAASAPSGPGADAIGLAIDELEAGSEGEAGEVCAGGVGVAQPTRIGTNSSEREFIADGLACPGTI